MRTPNDQGIVVDGLRACVMCLENKTLDLFGVNRKGLFGRNAFCRACEKIRRKQYRQANRDRIARQKAAAHQRRRAARHTDEIDRVTVEELRDECGDNCAYCHVEMDFSPTPRGAYNPLRASIDHIVPLSRGGNHRRENLTLACLGCNISKGTRLVEELTWR